MADDTTKIIRIVVDSSRAVDGSAAATRALAAIQQQTASMSGMLAGMENALGGVASAIKANLVLALADAASRLIDMGRAAFEAVAHLSDLAEQLGTTTRNLQALQYSAALSGVGIDQMQTAVGKFSQKIGEAANGSKAQIDALDRLGVKILDVNGHLRDNESVMQDVAQRILAIEDPARRSAAAVEFFGKSGTAMLSTLGEIAKGQDAMATATEKAGAMVSDFAARRLKELGDSLDAGKLKTRAFLAEGLAAILDWLDRNDFAQKLIGGFGLVATYFSQVFPQKLGDLDDSLHTAFDSMTAAGLGFVAGFLETFRQLPDQLGKLMVDGINGMLRALGSGLGAVNNFIADKLPWLNVGRSGVPVPQLPGGGASLGGAADAVSAAAAAASSGYLAGRPDYAGLRRGIRMQDADAAARRGSLAAVGGAGVSNPTSTEAGQQAQSLAERIKKETDALAAAAAAQERMTAAARAGDVAFLDQQAAAEATQKAIEVYGGKLDATNPKVQALAATWKDLILAQKEGAAAQSFVAATTELDKQNVLLQAQLGLMNQAPDVQARELAIIKAKQEAEKAGAAVKADDLANRTAAIEANERLKMQAEQVKAANELMLEPVKQGLRDIQTLGTSVWQSFLDSGTISAQSIGQTMVTTFKKVAAEMLSLMTFRPAMQLFVQGATALGFVSPAMANSMGYSVAGAGAAGGASGYSASLMQGGGFGGLGSLGSLGGGGSGAGWLGSVGTFLSNPIIGPSAAAYEGVIPGMTGAQAAAYFNSGSMSTLGGLTWGQGISGIAGLGMGAYQMLSSGGSAGGMIGGGASMLGGLTTLLGPALGLGSAAGPIGMGIALGGTLLASLIGGGGPQIPAMPGLNYRWTDTPQTAVQALIGASGGLPIQGKLYTGGVGSGTMHTWNGSQWVGQDYTQGGISSPTGQQINVGGGLGVSMSEAQDQVTAELFRYDVLNGAIKNIGDTLVKVFQNVDVNTTKGAQDAITFANAYDQLGKAANPVKDSLAKLNSTFGDLSAQANFYRLSLDPINAELDKETKRTAQDFIDNMINPLAAQLRAVSDSQKAALASAQYINANISSVYADTSKIAAYYTQQQTAAVNQFFGGLQDAIDQLTYGNLSGASAATTFAGVQAKYQRTLALAQSGDATAASNVSSDAIAYANAARTFFASSPEEASIIAGIRQDLTSLSINAGGTVLPGPTASLTTNVVGDLNNTQNIAHLIATVSDLSDMVTMLVNQQRAATVNRM